MVVQEMVVGAEVARVPAGYAHRSLRALRAVKPTCLNSCAVKPNVLELLCAEACVLQRLLPLRRGPR
eukprot:1307830-Heterocapsa_arctica.AAC.1